MTVSGTSTFSGAVVGAFTNFQVFDSSGTFNTTGKSKIMIEVWGGGGGGGGGGTGGGNGTDGGTTAVTTPTPTTLISATGGIKGIGGGIDYYGGNGGTSSATFNLQGKSGSSVNVSVNNAYTGAFGGDSPRGGMGGINFGGNSIAGQVPGGGGAGDSRAPASSSYSGTSGGGGGYGMQIFTAGINYTIGDTLTIIIGVGGAGGVAGTGGNLGGAGAPGRVVVWW